MVELSERITPPHMSHHDAMQDGASRLLALLQRREIARLRRFSERPINTSLSLIMHAKMSRNMRKAMRVALPKKSPARILPSGPNMVDPGDKLRCASSSR